MKQPLKVKIATLAGVLSGLSFVASLLLYTWARIPFPDAFTYVSAPGMVILTSLALYARNANLVVFYGRLKTGLWVGAAATGAYDLARLVGVLMGVGYTGYQVIPEFGTLLTGAPPDSSVATVVGLAYHVVNGVLFGMVYSIMAGRARWYWALPWGLLLEAGMIITYPKAFGVNFGVSSALLWVSLLGHTTYSLVLGKLLQRYNA